jgi:hypothetical protein
MKRGKPLSRRTAMRKVRHDRIRARRAAAFGPQAELCKQMRCLACGAWPSDAHHHPSRAAGGKDRDCIPLCREHHMLVHAIGTREFYKRTRVDVVAEVQHMREIVAGTLPRHDGRCTDASICNACQDHAESVNERNVYR